MKAYRLLRSLKIVATACAVVGLLLLPLLNTS
jgi:hypothetical protein